MIKKNNDKKGDDDMSMLLKQLEQEETELNRQIDFLINRIPLHPTGSLYISSSNGSDQFYTIGTDKRDLTGKKKYLKKENRQLAVSISQRDYEMKLLKELQIRKNAVRRARKTYERTDPEKVLSCFPQGKQDLIKPLFLTREEYVRRWLEVDYERKGFQENTPEFYTAKGERVRSKSEKIIADTLFRFEVPYRYEYPLELKGYGTIHPDFTVLNTESREEFFWEHLGQMDDEKYVRDALIRIHFYERNNYLPGKELIITSETKNMPLDMRVVDCVIQRFL